MPSDSRTPVHVLLVGDGTVLSDAIGPQSFETGLDRPISVTVANSVADGIEAHGDHIHCIVAAFDLLDGTATDLLDAVGTDPRSPPVVVVVDSQDGQVPAATVSEQFADVVLGDDDTATLRTRIIDAVTDVVPDGSGPTLGGDHPKGSRAVDAWKASIFDQYFTDVPLHMYVKDTDARHVAVSEARVDRRVHRDSETYLGRRDIDGIVPESEARGPYEDDLRVIETGEPIVHKEEHYRASDRWFLTSKVRWEDAGEVRGLVGIAQEVTARRDREHQLLVTSHVLRHTLRNKLNVILGSCERIEAGGDVADNVARIHTAASALTSTVDNQQAILDIMVGNPEATPTDLSTVVTGVLDGIKERHEGVTIESELPEDIFVLATENVHRAVEQLVNNAVVHAGAQPTVAVTLSQDDNTATLQVEDRCPAIPPLEVEVLTGERRIDHLNHSAGLGLWIVRWVMRHCRGDIAFDRRSDGNVVTLTFQIADYRAG